MASIKQIPGAKEGFAEAKRLGISYDTYWQRIVYMGYPPEVAATMPLGRGRPRNPDSVRQKCLRAGVNRRKLYTLRQQHPDTPIDELIASLQEESQS